MTSGADTIHNFLFEGSNVRGIHVRLEESWQAVLSRNPYPIAAQSLLGEALAASTLLGATVKMDGTLTLQTRGDGPVKMLVVQVTGARTVRGPLISKPPSKCMSKDVPLHDFDIVIVEGIV